MFSNKNNAIISACYNRKQKRSQTIINLPNVPQNLSELQINHLSCRHVILIQTWRIFFCYFIWFTVYKRWRSGPVKFHSDCALWHGRRHCIVLIPNVTSWSYWFSRMCSQILHLSHIFTTWFLWAWCTFCAIAHLLINVWHKAVYFSKSIHKGSKFIHKALFEISFLILQFYWYILMK